MWADWLLSDPARLLAVLVSTVAMYVTVIVFARWSGVRSFSQMSSFDIAVTIGIGSLVATTVAAQKPPLLQGMVALFVLYGLQLLVSRLRVKFQPVGATVDNRPILLMGPGGNMLAENMEVARVTEDDLRQQMRKANVLDTTRVQAVVMEGTGNIHVMAGHSGDPRLSLNSWVLGNVRDYSQSTLRERDQKEGETGA
jgi:uncharacterized membrane protein YcaP (DUF421 family)